MRNILAVKHADLPIPPLTKLAVIACIDARLTADSLRLSTGHSHIIRNAQMNLIIFGICKSNI